MAQTKLCGTCLVAILLIAQPVFAVVVYKKGSNKPVAGHLVRQNGNEVVIRDERTPGVSEVVIPRSEIEDLIETVSLERLEALDPGRPQEYREYAEELAEKRLDPEARLMAVRLFQIAAWLDPAKTGRGALLGLVSVARPGEEEARFRAAAYLFDPRHDKALLGQTPPPGGREKMADDPVQGLLEALRLLRRGHGQLARAALAPPAVHDELTAHQGILSHEDFLAASSTKELWEEQLRKVVELELALDSKLHGGGEQRAQTTLASWNDDVRAGNLAAIRSLQFDKLTPFDPRECVFRQGKWQRTDAGK
ncbi:MAG: hypothetical protein IAF94_02260 [Pirellulaceae bacterium]|nr:hypothetical protein [Pirellulaceae bacterium]